MIRVGKLVLLLMMLAGFAGASTVTMQLVGFGGASAGGPNISNGLYVYPYYFSIDGSQDLTALLCDSYDNEVWQNETWTADKVSLASLVGGPDGDKYIEAAWLFAQMGTHPTPADAATYNFAVWGLFSQNALNSPGYAATGAANVLPTPDQLVGFNYSHFYVYVPREGTAMLNGQRVNTMPQEYIGFEQTPEPGTLALLGSGLLGLAIKFRRAR